MPVHFGDLGICSVSTLAPSAFLASAAGTSDLQDIILPQSYIFTDNFVGGIQDIWSNLSGSDIPTDLSYSQKCWDERVSEFVHPNLLEKFSDNLSRARLLAVSAPHSGDWLNALPICAAGSR